MGRGKKPATRKSALTAFKYAMTVEGHTLPPDEHQRHSGEAPSLSRPPGGWVVGLITKTLAPLGLMRLGWLERVR